MDWAILAWVKRGKRRTDILQIFYKAKKPLTSNDIKIISKISLSQISVIISNFDEKNLIICKNPNDKLGRLYEISDDGKSIVSELSRGFDNDN
jgi:hypothetical protein